MYPGKIFRCPNGVCCAHVGDDELIFPPFLGRRDRQRLTRLENVVPEKHFVEKRDPKSGTVYFQLGTGGCVGCDFFDSKTGHCTVYKFRPLDCKLFPLTLDLQQETLMWIVYLCACLPAVSNIDIQRFTEYAERRILPLFTDEDLWLYAQLPGDRMYELGQWRILRPVKRPEKSIQPSHIAE